MQGVVSGTVFPTWNDKLILFSFNKKKNHNVDNDQGVTTINI